MKNRNIPFGYQYQNGKIEIDKYELQILFEIINAYLSGTSLLQISKILNEKQIEYTKGIIGWNKARLMRILQDKRYIGTDTYPQIISEDTHTKLVELKSAKNTKKNLDYSAGVFNINVPVICPNCGLKMYRYHDRRRKCTERWICKSCRTNIPISDSCLLDEITNILNKVINNPNLIEDKQSSKESFEKDPSIEVIKAENEINRILENGKLDKEIL